MEARLRGGARDGAAVARASRRARFETQVGRLCRTLGLAIGGFDGRTYLAETLSNTDFRKFDEALRMVLDVTEDQIVALDRALEARHDRGELCYGIHRSADALITCIVKSYSGDHVHFVDGSDGGYALAAKQLKAQLKALS